MNRPDVEVIKNATLILICEGKVIMDIDCTDTLSLCDYILYLEKNSPTIGCNND